MKAKPAKPSRRGRGKPTATPDRTAGKLFDRVASILDEARSSVVRAVNSRMVLAYWLIGREIVQELQKGEQRAAYGKSVLDRLSSLLTSHYGAGFSPTNLRCFRVFYCTYTDRASSIQHTACAELNQTKGLSSNNEIIPIRDSLRAESLPPFHPSLSWSHYRAIMRVEKPEARDFYEQEAVAAGWNVRELERQIHSLYYERLLASRDKKGMLLGQRKAPDKDPSSILKSSAVLEFLGLPDSSRLHESDLYRVSLHRDAAVHLPCQHLSVLPYQPL